MSRARRFAGRPLVAGVLLAGALVAGCSDAASEGIPSEAYVAALTPFLPDTPADGDDRPVVYVAAVGESPLDLAGQVGVIDALAEHYDVRFVDDFQAALDDGGDDDPVPHDDGRLLAIGTIRPEPPHSVRVEDYLAAERTAAHLVTVTERGGHWSVRSVEDVDPEVLVGDG